MLSFVAISLTFNSELKYSLRKGIYLNINIFLLLFYNIKDKHCQKAGYNLLNPLAGEYIVHINMTWCSILFISIFLLQLDQQLLLPMGSQYY